MVIQANPSQVRIFLACSCKYFKMAMMMMMMIMMMITTINDNYVVMTIITFVFETAYYAGADTEVVWHNLKILLCHNVCNCWLINNILYKTCRYIYDTPSYQFHMPSFRDSLFPSKLGKYRFHAPTLLLFYILLKGYLKHMSH